MYETYDRPPMSCAPEFEVERISLPAGRCIDINDSGVCSVLVVVNGVCDITVKEGDVPVVFSAPELVKTIEGARTGIVVFMSAHYSYEITASQDVELFRSHINLELKS